MLFDEIAQTIGPQEEIHLSKDAVSGAPENLSVEESRNEWFRRSWAVTHYIQPHRAYRLLKRLQERLAGADQPLAAQYEDVRTWLSYAGMVALPRRDFVSFFRERNLRAVLASNTYDVLENVRARLAQEPLAERDGLREEIYRALRENSIPLFNTKPADLENGSIGGWLAYIDRTVAVGPLQAYERTTFENEVSNQAHLSENERRILRRLVDLYEFIKLSSLSLKGNEEDVALDVDDGVYLYTKGKEYKVEDADGGTFRAEAPTLQNQVFSTAPKAQPLPHYAKISERARGILKNTQGNTVAVRAVLENTLALRSVEEALGALLLLAQLRQLDNLMEDPRFSKLVVDDLKKLGRDDMISGLHANPAAPQYVARLLKVILEDRLGLSHADAINFGSRLAKILAMEGEKYQSIIKQGKWSL
ncbi:MAG: hypothetical protein Q8P78_02610 [bacterium]|nr:hypothetical protein [bacterium]